MYISAKTIVNGMTRNEAKTVLKKIYARFGHLHVSTTKNMRAPEISEGELALLQQGNRIGAIAEYSSRTGKSLLVSMRTIDRASVQQLSPAHS